MTIFNNEEKTQKRSMFQRTIVIAYLIFMPFYVWAISDLDNAFSQPILKPYEVVRLQLLAMQKNDVSDHGIEITFRFASPSKQDPNWSPETFYKAGQKSFLSTLAESSFCKFSGFDDQRKYSHPKCDHYYNNR